MTQAIFQTAPLLKRSFLQKVFGQYPEENSIIELNNLLALKPVKQISIKEVQEIESRYNIKLNQEFRLNLEEFYAVYLNHCLKDRLLSDEELEELNWLKKTLSLSDKTIDGLHLRIGEVTYKQSFQGAVGDGKLTEAEKEFLNKLEKGLKLPKELAEKISKETRTAFIQNYVNNIINDQRLSPSEEKELQTIAANLNVNVEFDEKTQRHLQKLKLYWALENLEIPSIQADIALQKAESCFIQIQNVKWYELRSSRQRASNSKLSAKRFYSDSGGYSPSSLDQMTLIDEGGLYLTNKRILFTGLKKNSNIRLEKILHITPYSDGVEIGKDAGKSPLLQFSDRTDIFCIILERLITER